MSYMYFNPHEREARDLIALANGFGLQILIHTSVKLVTSFSLETSLGTIILIHTSVKLVTLKVKLSSAASLF